MQFLWEYTILADGSSGNFEFPNECQAYNAGISYATSLPESINKKYMEQVKSSEMNFVKKNYLMANLSAWLNAMPYIKGNNGKYSSFPEYLNSRLSNYIDRRTLLERYPLIGLGINSDGKIKSSTELMNQYFSNKFKLNGSTYSMSPEELKSIEEIYMYLLIPRLQDGNAYNELCNRFGKDKINDFLKRMGQHIEQKQESIREAYKWITYDMRKLEGHDSPITLTSKELMEKMDYSQKFLVASKKLIQEYTGVGNQGITMNKVNEVTISTEPRVSERDKGNAR